MLARISDAEAIAVDEPHAGVGSVAGAVLGVGASEAPRKVLSLDELKALIQAEAEEIEAVLAKIDDTSAYAIELREKYLIVREYIP